MIPTPTGPADFAHRRERDRLTRLRRPLGGIDHGDGGSRPSAPVTAGSRPSAIASTKSWNWSAKPFTRLTVKGSARYWNGGVCHSVTQPWPSPRSTRTSP